MKMKYWVGGGGGGGGEERLLCLLSLLSLSSPRAEAKILLLTYMKLDQANLLIPQMWDPKKLLDGAFVETESNNCVIYTLFGRQ